MIIPDKKMQDEYKEKVKCMLGLYKKYLDSLCGPSNSNMQVNGQLIENPGKAFSLAYSITSQERVYQSFSVNCGTMGCE